MVIYHRETSQRIEKQSSDVPKPVFRYLRGYAFDPSLSVELETALINQITFKVDWEDNLRIGPVGEYLEVIDYDPASKCFYPPMDLNDPRVLAQDGLPPSEANVQFHQQMVYAVAMTTIKNFERALGRKALWWPYWQGPAHDEIYIPRLRLYPHAMRRANAYYNPEKRAVLFGYFPASADDPGNQLPGATVFTCLSHDIVAHEMTHALLDGMHRRYIEPSHPDVLAFHEAFADIVALFQHFSFPEVLRNQIARTRGDLASQNRLGELAQQFGKARGGYGALRDAIGKINPETKRWEPLTPDPNEYLTVFEPHQRGAILVATIFDAFITIYKSRVADLLRIATNGTGVLPAGALHPDLVNRLADEAAKSARHVLQVCIRALDYTPPVAITFGDYLRALITADVDVVPDDPYGYRIAFIEAFRRRGIYPNGIRNLSVESLRWPEVNESPAIMAVVRRIWERLLRTFVNESPYIKSREDIYTKARDMRAQLNLQLQHEVKNSTNEKSLRELTKLIFSANSPALTDTLREEFDPEEKRKVKFEVHSLRLAQRVGPDGDLKNQLILTIMQQRLVKVGDSNQPMPFRGGCTLIIDPHTLDVQYAITRPIIDPDRLDKQQKYTTLRGASLDATYFGIDDHGSDGPFALLHSGLG